MNAQLHKIFKQFLRYRILLFLLLVIGLYGFIAFRIHMLADAEPAQSAVDSQTALVKTSHIDQSTISKVTQLHDNSVNVRSLFNQARQNPFHE